VSHGGRTEYYLFLAAGALTLALAAWLAALVAGSCFAYGKQPRVSSTAMPKMTQRGDPALPVAMLKVSFGLQR
jgi:hypothetical protein